MKTTLKKIVWGTAFLSLVISCKKSETVGYADSTVEVSSPEMMSDSISSVATLKVAGKDFIKTANVEMEVKEVYNASMQIEKIAAELGGFVVHSKMQSQIRDENTYAISDEKAMLVRKYRMENTLQMRVPTESLGVFLEKLNDQKVFLNSRLIDAEDVTANIRLAKLEAERNRKIERAIGELKPNTEAVTLKDNQLREKNDQNFENQQMADRLKYSVVDILLKEPNVNVAKIPVANIKNIDQQYQYHFWFDIKNAVISGFLLIQTLLVGLVNIWPLLLLVGAGIFFWKKRKSQPKPN